MKVGDRVSTGYCLGTILEIGDEAIKVGWGSGIVGTILLTQLEFFNLSVIE